MGSRNLRKNKIVGTKAVGELCIWLSDLTNITLVFTTLHKVTLPSFTTLERNRMSTVFSPVL